MNINSIAIKFLILFFVLVNSNNLLSQTESCYMSYKRVYVVDSIKVKNPHVIFRMEKAESETTVRGEKRDSVQLCYLVSGCNFSKLRNKIDSVDIYPKYGNYTLRSYIRLGLGSNYLPFDSKKNYEYSNFNFKDAVVLIEEKHNYRVFKYYEEEMEFYVLLVCKDSYLVLLDYYYSSFLLYDNYVLVLIPKHPLQIP